MPAVVRVPRLPPPFLGGRLWRGGVGVLPSLGCAPPLPFGFLFFFWLCGVGRWLSRSWVPWSLSPYPFSSGPRCLLFVCIFYLFLPSVVCVRVCWVSLLQVGRCPWLGVAGFRWVVLRRPFWGMLSSVPPGWGVWAPLVVLVGGVVAVGRSRAPPPSLLFVFLWGVVCLFPPLPCLDWRTHWSAFCVVFWFTVGGCILPGCAPAPWVGWVMYTLG